MWHYRTDAALDLLARYAVFTSKFFPLSRHDRTREDVLTLMIPGGLANKLLSCAPQVRRVQSISWSPDSTGFSPPA